MSVQTNQYAGFGYWLDYKQAEAALEAKYDEDGMNGEYFFFGKIDAKSEAYEPLNIVIVKAPSAKVKKALKEEIVNVFGTDFGVKPASLVFTHYR